MAQSSAARKALQDFHVVSPTEFNILGRIKWFSKEKGYGFVVCEGRDDIFLHKEILRKIGLKDINPNRPVRVTFGQGPKGLVATELNI